MMFRNGCERSGLFCALSHICDQIYNEQEFDIFHAVCEVRATRQQFITKVSTTNIKITIIIYFSMAYFL